MSLVFRRGQPADVPDFARLASMSFPAVEATQPEWGRILTDSPHGGIETLWIGEEDGRIVAGCRLLRFRQWIAGAKIPVMGLSTVAISAADRRRGLASRLASSALHEARERGDLASVLYPFRDAFYRKLGYGLAGEAHQYLIRPSSLPDHSAHRRVSIPASPGTDTAFGQVYDRWVPTQNGQMERAGRAWETVFQENSRHGAVCYDHDSLPTGYAIFRFPKERVAGETVLEVEEIVWLDHESRLALYRWLSSLSDQWGYLLYRAHPQERFPEYLSGLRRPIEGIHRWHYWFPVATVMYGPMFRLLNIAEAWAARPVHSEPVLTVALQLHDEQIRENGGSWRLRFGEGRCVVEPGGEGADLKLTIGIEPLSRLYIGAITPSAAVDVGLAEVDRPELLPILDSLLVVPNPWTFDRF